MNNINQAGKENINIGIINGDVDVYLNQESSKLSEKEILEGFKYASEDLIAHKSNFGNSGNVFLQRNIVSNILNWINTDLKIKEEPIAVLAGNAGYGKSVVMKQLQNKLNEEDIACLAIKSDKLIVNTIAELQSELEFPSLSDLISRLLKSRDKCVVLIDQIDALSLSLSSNRNPINTYNRLINSLKRIPNVRVVISCRIYDLEFDPYLQQYNNLKKYVLDKLELEETKYILEKLNINVSSFSDKFIQFLRIPLHIEIFTSVHSNATTPKEYQSLNELYDEYWRQKILEVPDERIKTVNFVNKITALMFNEQKIAVLKRNFESEFHKEIKYLSSIGVIASSGNTLQFIHQSFFDYSNARSFVESGKKLSSQLLQNKYHQGLFIRSRVKYVILYLKAANQELYIEELKTLLFSDKLRYHLKLLLISTLAYMDDVNSAEKEIIFELSKKNESLYISFIEYANSQAWIDELVMEQNIINKLKDQKFNNCIYVLLSRILESNPEAGLNELKKIPEFDGKRNFIVQLISRTKNIRNQEFLKYFDEYFDQEQNSHNYYYFLENAIPFHPDWVFKRMETQYYKNNQSEVKGNYHERYEERNVYKTLLKVYPKKTISFFIDILLNLAAKEGKLFKKLSDENKYYSGLHFWHYAPQSKNQDTSDLQHFIADSVLAFLIEEYQKDSDFVLSIFDKFHNTNSFILHALTIPTIIAHKENFIEFVFDYLNSKYELFTIYNQCDVYEYYFRELIKTFYPLFTEGQKIVIDNYIVNAVPKEEKIKGSFYKSGITNHGQNWFGITKFKLISEIPENLRKQSEKLDKEFKELSRKFKISTNKKPVGITVTSGERTMSDSAYEKMNVDQWIKSFIKYQGDDSPPWDENVSELGHSRKFEQLCKENSKKMMPVLKASIENNNVPISYIIYGFHGLSQSNHDITEIQNIFNSIVNNRIEDIKEFPLQMLIWSTDVFIKNKVNQKETIDFLSMVIENAPDSQIAYQDLYTAGLNSIRGAAIDRLVKCYVFDGYGETIFSTIEKIAKEASIISRASAISNLALLNNLDKERNLKLYLLLNHDFDPDLLALPLHNLHPLVYLIHVDFNKLIPFFEKAIEIKESHKVISHILFFAFLRSYKRSEELLQKVLDSSEEAKATVLNVAIENMNKDEFFEKCYNVALSSLKNSSEKITEVYHRSFYRIEPQLFPKIEEFLVKYTTLVKNNRDNHAFYSYIDKSLKHFQSKEVAIKCIEIVSRTKNEMDSFPYYENEPLKIIIDAYSIIRDYSKKNQYLEAAMDTFDQFLKLPSYSNSLQGMLNKLDESVL
jgi:hypothetical protein